MSDQLRIDPPLQGFHINTSRYGKSTHVSPSWAKPLQRDKWNRRGVIVWDAAECVITSLTANHVLHILETIAAEPGMMSRGLTLGEPAVRLNLTNPSELPQNVMSDTIHLVGEWANDFVELLHHNESVLRHMAEQETKEKNEALLKVYDILLRIAQRREIEELDTGNRALPWIRDTASNTFICEQLPNRATVVPTEGTLSWHVSLERPNRFKHWSPYFARLEEALTWAEQELQAINDEALAPITQGLMAAARALPFEGRVYLEPYRIRPEVPEPARITYRVVIDLEYASYDFKTMEMAFGKQFRYDERYHPPCGLAREVRLDASQFSIEQPLGPRDGWYHIVSRVTYYHADTATIQAQQLWDRSVIVQRYQEGKALRARYGVEEVETGYTTWIGACEDAKQPWQAPQSRTEHMEERAIRLTLIHALDIDGFRAFLRITKSDLSDHNLLARMHRQRAKSPYMSERARAESERWLQGHGDEDI